jgi:hypothetical protein
MQWGMTRGATVRNLEVAEVGLLEDVADRTGTAAGATLEAVEDEAVVSEANKPPHEKVSVYFFFLSKNYVKP